jgi:hypothetical protein
MAYLWAETAGEWSARKLDGSVMTLPVANNKATEPQVRSPRLIQTHCGGKKTWALVAGAGCDARVNGRAIPAGLAVLDHRDAILAGDERFFFSAESLASVEPFPGAARPVHCGRCKLPIAMGSPAVSCPNCNVWYHQDESPEGSACYTYAEQCGFCSCETRLDAVLAWAPEE